MSEKFLFQADNARIILSMGHSLRERTINPTSVTAEMFAWQGWLFLS